MTNQHTAIDNLGNRRSSLGLRSHNYRGRHAFSLLEVILALALSVVIVAAISTSVHIHMATLTRQQSEIEQKQIARSVIMMITNDVRAAIQYKPQDYSGLENLIVSQAMIAGIADAAGTPSGDGGEGDGGEGDGGEGDGGEGDGGDGEGGDGEGGGGDNGQGSGGENGDSANVGQTEESSGDVTGGAQESEMEECVSCRPTLFGNNRVLMVDVSRLPRVDQYNPLVASNQSDRQLPSDVKAVTYFFSDTAAEENSDLFGSGVNGGLYRRQIDRAVAAFRGEVDMIDRADEFTQLIAPEVAEVSFRYFNGEDWMAEWDSETENGFPPAIEVTVIIDPDRVRQGESRDTGPVDPDATQVYRTVIHLPVAEVPTEKEEEQQASN